MNDGRIRRRIALAFIIVLCFLGCQGSGAYAAQFAISAGNHGWHVAGDTVKPLTIVYRNCPDSRPTVSIYTKDLQAVPLSSADYYAGKSFLQLYPSYLATLPLGDYQMSIQCSSGSATAYFYVIAQETIIFVEQPQTVTIDKGDNATFTVQVTGSSGYSYQWQRRSRTGWKTVQGATTSTMTLRSVPGSMTGYQYRVLVHSAAGDAYSDTARVFVLNITPTGDQASPGWYAAGAVASLAVMAGCAFLWRRKGTRRGQERRNVLNPPPPVSTACSNPPER